MEEDKTLDEDKKPKLQSLDLSNLEDPKEEEFLIRFLKKCWRGVQYDEEAKVFSLDPDGH